MKKLLLFIMVAIYKNHGQINFGSKFSSNIPTRENPRTETGGGGTGGLGGKSLSILAVLARELLGLPRSLDETLTGVQKEYMSEGDFLHGTTRVRNSDGGGTLPQQVLIRTFSRYTSSDCTGTMLTDSIAITAAHCVNNRGSNNDVVVYPPEKNCCRLSSNRGIKACKVAQKFEGDICQSNGHDIALVRLSRRMPGMRSLRLNFKRIKPGRQTIMAGTGVNFNRTCESQISYQTVVDCSRVSCYGRQWYCTEGSYKETSGACRGDAGGPSWTFGSGLSGLTAAATVDSENDPCTNGYSLFTNLNYYKNWIECNMGGPMNTCDSDLRNVHPNLKFRGVRPQPCPFVSDVSC